MHILQENPSFFVDYVEKTPIVFYCIKNIKKALDFYYYNMVKYL